jgi:hypothetical protein
VRNQFRRALNVISGLGCATRSLVTFTMVAALLFSSVIPARAFDDDDRDHAPHFGHVFVIVLENEGYDTTFGPTSKAPYLSQTLVSKGVLLTQYYGTGHASNDNYIAMISGQAATPENRNDCVIYGNFLLTGVTPDGQAIGSGCIYPESVKTIADQLSEIGLTWRSYNGDMGNDPTRESATCGHPALNTTDMTQNAEPPSAAVLNGDQYVTRHNPFVYFHSIIDSPACQTGVVNLNKLSTDLQKIETTPNFVFITPNVCDDGHDSACVNGQTGGEVGINNFLQKIIPMIQASPAYKRDGLIVINFDEGGYTLTVNSSGGYVIAFQGQACCSEQPGPNLGSFPQSTSIGPYTLTEGSYGGDRTGAVLLSPLLKPGTVSYTPFNHYSLLRSLEDNFRTRNYLGYAGQPGLISFFGSAHSDIQVKDDDRR